MFEHSIAPPAWQSFSLIKCQILASLFMVFDTLTLRFSRFANRTPSLSAFFTYICTHFVLAHMHLHGVARRVFIKKRSSTCHLVCDRALSLHSTLSLISSPPLSWSSSSMWSKPPSNTTLRTRRMRGIAPGDTQPSHRL